MATLSHAESRRMYSWWWDSHVSPKNSKWLQENLTDMDVKVKSMIKLIEEDADSFARRAEMYFKKRPELLKLVEEFYRAYRALAERYDHATGALRQAHRTIAEAFPNQVPLGLADDAPLEAECFATERRPTLSDPEELQKDSFGGSLSHLHAVQRSGTVIDEPDSATSKKGLKQLNDLFGSDEAAQRRPKSAEGRARRGLNFKEAEEPRPASSCDPVCRSEREIQALKDALSKLEAEKDANFSRYDQSLERLSNLESEVSRAQDDSKGINDKASNAEAEVQALKESLSRLEAEREAGRIEYQLCIERIQNLENTLSRAQQDAGELNQRASKAETEIQALKNELSRLEAEKDAVLLQYKESLDLISNLENKLLHAEERARRIHEQAGTAESEVGNLKHALALLSDEKDAAVLQCQQNKDKISSLEDELSCSQEETKWLKGEKESGIAKLKDTEEQYHLLEKSNHYLQSDLESMVLKMGEQNQELIEKQKEVGRLWACLQEERLRFMEAETAFQNLQHMHSHSQEELRSLTAELQKAVQILKDMEAHNHSLQDKIQKLIEENKNLSEINLSSAESMDNMKDQMSKLRHIKLQLEEEVGLRVDQRNALQQEIYCLKEELSDLNKKLYALIEQIKSVGLQPESVGSSVKELQDKSSKLREVIEKESSEKASLSEKLEIMESILEKNKVLENSLSDLNAELDGFRGKAKALEESCEFLVGEKMALISEKEALVSQLQSMRQNYDNLSEKSGLLENSLSDAHSELEGLREKLKSVENSCELLGNEKCGLLSERDSLASKFEITQQRLEDLENRYTHLEDRHSCLESDKESVLQKLEELTVSLDSEKHKHSKFAESSEARLAGLETQVRVLQEDSWTRKKEIEEGIDKAVNAQIEIFILQKCIQDLEERNYSLLIDCEKFFRLSKYSEKLISDLQKENLEQRIEAKDLNGLIKKLRMGISQIYKALELDSDYGATYEKGEEQLILNHALLKLQDARASLSNFQDENQKLVIEKSVYATVFVQLEMDAANLQEEKNMTDQELRITAEQLSVLQSETHKLSIMNENLTLKSQQQEQKEKMLTASIEDLNGKLSLLEEAYQDMETENAIKIEEKTYLMTKLLNAMEQNHSLKEENSAIFDEAFSQSNLSMILMTSVVEKTEQQRELCVSLDKFQGINNTLGDRVDVLDQDLETSKMEILFLKELLDKSEKLLQTEKLVSDLLKFEVARKNDLLYQKGVDLLEAEQKLTAIEIERFLWVNTIKELKTKFDELEETREDQKKQILRLAQDNVHWGDQNEGLHEEIRRSNNDLQSLHYEREAAKAKEERLYSDLRKEVELWQNEAATFFGELQVSAVREAMFEEKIHELSKICERFQDQIISKDTEIDLLNGRARTLEDETGGLKSQLDLFMPVFAALNEGLTSLESRTLMYAKSNSTKDVAVKDTNASYPDAEPCQKLVEDQIPRTPYGFPDVQSRIVAVEKAVTEMEKAAEKEILTANMKLEAAMRHIEELQSRKNWNYGNAQTKNHGASDDLKLSKPQPEIWEAANELLTKDIMLDQMSESSSYWNTKRDGGRAASRSSDLWDTVDRNDSIALEVRKLKNTNAAPTGKHQIKTVEEHKTEHPYPGVMAEKELGVDLLEISRSFREQSQGGNKRKILERLASDAQKLTNLDITVQDLKRKVELNEKSKKEKGIEYDTVKVQLEEAEEAIQKLFDSNGKLAKNVQDKVLPSGKSGMELEENGSARRRRISEQARRGSEKIGRLQVEVQQLQFLLLKLDDETEKKAKIRVPERKTRVLLRDYLYGGLRPKSKQKKSHCCSCVQPPTRGD